MPQHRPVSHLDRELQRRDHQLAQRLGFEPLDELPEQGIGPAPEPGDPAADSLQPTEQENHA